MSPASKNGFTLIEIVFVIALIAIISTVVATRFEAINSLKEKSSIRHFVNTWEFLYTQAKAKNETYILIIDLGKNSYQVRSAIAKENGARQRDVLNDFRTKSEQERIKKEKAKNNKENGNNIYNDDTLNSEFYRKIFNDPHADYELGTPIDFPSLAKEEIFPADVKIKDVKVGNEYFTNNKVEIHFSANGATDFAIVHFQTDKSSYTAMINPATGKVKLYNKEIDFDWSLEKNQNK